MTREAIKKYEVCINWIDVRRESNVQGVDWATSAVCDTSRDGGWKGEWSTRMERRVEYPQMESKDD